MFNVIFYALFIILDFLDLQKIFEFVAAFCRSAFGRRFSQNIGQIGTDLSDNWDTRRRSLYYVFDAVDRITVCRYGFWWKFKFSQIQLSAKGIWVYAQAYEKLNLIFLRWETEKKCDFYLKDSFFGKLKIFVFFLWILLALNAIYRLVLFNL